MAPFPPSASSAGAGEGTCTAGFHVTVEFCGGLEQLTSTKKKTLRLTFVPQKKPLPTATESCPDEASREKASQQPVKLYQLVSFLSAYIITERPELFAEGYEPRVAKSAGGPTDAAHSARSSAGSQGSEVAVSSNHNGTGNDSRESVFSLDLLTSGSLAPMRIRPGVLSLVNDVDAEVDGGMEAPVPEGACVTFISTLHGG
ncbi:ubiquitin related modifier protein [Cystoisospora suis]|uniref:Ubiquitin-related modifier 1 n=1 Tax=Cystoisospora suis TaxID=483139 RepID=A0A2C6KV41_9APIC|nr:ubiquitin related modifier protein [Cystoisospora suis]